MTAPLRPPTVTIALIGNPNTGKSTLFNALAGVRQRVGNYPGVTVEKKIGRFEAEGRSYTLLDLPGTYSLAPRSPDEMIAVDVLLGRRDDVHAPDVVLCIVDASNLERNLYLVSQVLELGLPVVLALNMTDVAAERGVQIDHEALSARLGVPVVPLQANRGRGLQELVAGLNAALDKPPAAPPSIFPQPFQQEVEQLAKQLRAGLEKQGAETLWPRYLVERLLLDVGGYLSRSRLPGLSAEVRAELEAARERLAKGGCPAPGVEPVSRYRWVGETLRDVMSRPTERPQTFSDRLDRILTHKLLGSLVFLLLMTALFWCVFRIADPASQGIDWLMGLAADGVTSVLEEGPLHSLLINGVIGGVGGVLVFLPQIFVLFFFIGVLEDCGYMARAAYLMDKLMSRAGLSGKSFIPMLSSFACAIPGIMATRVIENPRDRLATILVAPLMSCSARLPVYVLLIAAFIPKKYFLFGLVGLQDLTMLAMYLVGIVAAVVVAFVLKSTLLRGAAPPFVMELPSYKVPELGNVLWRMGENGWQFVRRAGTIIFAVSVVVWALAYYPRSEGLIDPAAAARQAELEGELAALEEDAPEREALESELSAVNNRIEGDYLRHSFLGRAGHFVEPVVRPLGWDWRIGCAAIASFPAREVVVATMGVIYNLGSEQNEESESLRETLKKATWEGTERKVFTIPTALSLMVFFALCAQCASTLAVMRRETNSYRWPVFAFVYMTTLAYLAALATYQVGTWLGTFLPSA